MRNSPTRKRYCAQKGWVINLMRLRLTRVGSDVKCCSIALRIAVRSTARSAARSSTASVECWITYGRAIDRLVQIHRHQELRIARHLLEPALEQLDRLDRVHVA